MRRRRRRGALCPPCGPKRGQTNTQNTHEVFQVRALPPGIVRTLSSNSKLLEGHVTPTCHREGRVTPARLGPRPRLSAGGHPLRSLRSRDKRDDPMRCERHHNGPRRKHNKQMLCVNMPNRGKDPAARLAAIVRTDSAACSHGCTHPCLQRMPRSQERLFLGSDSSEAFGYAPPT
jgi:hypothetical protein